MIIKIFESINFDRMTKWKILQSFWQIGRLRHARISNKYGHNGNVFSQSCLDFYANKISYLLYSSASVRSAPNPLRTHDSQ